MLEVRGPDGSSYPVCAGDLAPFLRGLWQPSWRRAATITDDRTRELRVTHDVLNVLAALGVEHIGLSFAAGEPSKTRETKASLEDQLLDFGIDRQTCLIGIGGGVVLDIVGFVAATLLRGLPHVFVATTLLAQVDAAIGGKTGVDTPRAKNVVGAFYPPRAVLLHHESLASLSARDLRQGWAEAIKTAVVADAALFHALQGAAPEAVARGGVMAEELVLACAAVKVGVVSRDPFERGERAILNFGHTVGHAIEAACGFEVPHGEAVATGMLVEAALSDMTDTERARLRALLEQLGLPTTPQCSFERARSYLRYDKKGDVTLPESRVKCVLPARLGVVEPEDGSYARTVDTLLLQKAWSRCSA